ncbi:YceI family protein [Desulforhopalus sp. IMCC35007]|uniref:YceI family protein n=1 Tax=Desulforhopalus sp. IMCC35007 TaxID=2569543 RepID=UPI0010AE1D8A|nr:YceI family protein [Desulforhopalus sp. IMCC35007]TKB09980.1 polyisoprenoid-binding protein [Desulforhopalus sp. IMCC35007]
MQIYKSLCVLFLSLLFFPFASTAANTWEVDTGHSNIYFSVDHIFSKVHGHFNDFTSEIVFDPADAGNSSFAFTITVDSIDTNISKRDKHLQSADFFDSGKYSTITFVSTAVTPGDDGLYNITGKLTIKGKSYDLVLPLVLAGMKDHPAAAGKEVAGFNGKIVLDRLAYGVGTGKFYEMGLVGKDVEVFVSLEVTRNK